MSAQPPARGRRARSFVRPGLVLVTGALALTVAACSTSTPTAASPTTTPTTRQNTGGAQTPPGAFGTAAAVSATSLEVQSRQDGQVTVKFTAATKFTDTVKATLADVKAGQCVSVIAPSGGAQPKALTARTVQITTPSSSGCTAAGLGGGLGSAVAGSAVAGSPDAAAAAGRPTRAASPARPARTGRAPTSAGRSGR